MTPHTASNGRGTLVFDRVIAGVGRIRVASGTKSVALFDRMNRMVTRLKELRQLDVLVAMNEHRILPMDLFNLYEAGDLKSLPTGEGMQPLTVLWDTWVKDTQNVKTRAARRQARPLLEPHLPATPLLAHLPKGLRAFRRRMMAEGKPAQFNRVRAAVSAFLRDQLGQRDELYKDILAVPSLTERKTKRNAPTPDQALAFVEALPADLGALWWGMYVTGMNPKEYWGTWRLAQGGIEILGTKRQARHRLVPLVELPPMPAMHVKTFELRLAKKVKEIVKAGGTGWQPNDGRRGYEHLLELAGIQQTRRKQLFGHSLKSDVTSGYGGVDVTLYLEADGQAMQGVLKQARAQRKASAKKRLKLG